MSERSFQDWVTCPHCWHKFRAVDVVFVARHQDLVGDAVLGPDEQLRFSPSRFLVNGAALDPMGAECRSVACPRCHLTLARSLLECEKLSISVVGAPAAGKSYLLAAMTWELRQVLPRLGWVFSDAIPETNAILNANEKRLFLAENPDEPVMLEKTQTDGPGLYQFASIRGERVMLPKPFQFQLAPTNRSDKTGARVLVMYDNAGEHFLPGREEARAPVTEHLARANLIVFMLDPTQDPRLRSQLDSQDPQLRSSKLLDAAGLMRQESVLAEAIARTRSLSGIASYARHGKPLIIALAKCDIWSGVVDRSLPKSPLVEQTDGSLALDVELIRETSSRCREMLKSVCPEIVALAEDFTKSVLYVPTSATGCSPMSVERDGTTYLGFRPRDLLPRWASVPALCAIQAVQPRLIPIVKHSRERST